MKEAQHDVDEPNKTQDILALKLKKLEKNIRTYEAEFNHTQEGTLHQHKWLFQGLPPPLLHYSYLNLCLFQSGSLTP